MSTRFNLNPEFYSLERQLSDRLVHNYLYMDRNGMRTPLAWGKKGGGGMKGDYRSDGPSCCWQTTWSPSTAPQLSSHFLLIKKERERDGSKL